MTDHDATHDHDPDDVDAAHRLDRYLDRLARGGVRPEGGLDPRLAAAARALRTQREDATPDPVFVARLRETLTMDPTLTLPDSAATGATAPVPSPLATDRRYPSTTSRIGTGGRDRTRPVTSASATVSPVRPLRPVRRDGWRRRGWPVVEILGVAALILGLVSVLLGGNGGNGGLPAVLPGLGQNTAQSTPVADPASVAMGQGDAGRTGEMPGPGVADSPEVAWSRTLSQDYGGSFSSAPIVADGVVYLYSQGSASSQVNAYDLATGNLRWQYGFRDGRLEFGTPAIGAGLVFMAATNFGPFADDGAVLVTPGVEPEPYVPTGQLVAIDTGTGRERWSFDTGGIGYLPPLVLGDTVYVTDGMGMVQAIAISDGTLEWEAGFPVDGNTVDGITTPNASLSGADGTVYLATNTGTLYALDAASGDQEWSAELGGNYPTTPVVTDGVVYLTTGNLLQPFGPDDEATPESGGAPSISQDTGRLLAVDAMTGEEVWSRDLDSVIRSSVTVADGLVLVPGEGTDQTTLRAVDAATGADDQWSVQLAAYVNASVVVADGVGYLGSFGTDFAAINLSSGETLWSVEAIDTVYNAAFVSDGYVVFATAGRRSTLYAIRSADVATPMAGQDDPIDISGLPACDVEPRPAAATPLGNPDGTVPTLEVATPEATPAYVLPGIDRGDETQAPVIAWADIPVGDAVDADTVAGISRTFQAMQACSRPGYGSNVAAFYSGDYFLRSWVNWDGASNDTPFWYLRDGDFSTAAISDQLRMLPDGRVAWLWTNDVNPGYAQLYVFVEQDGRWLIDEFVEVTPDGVFRAG